MVKDRILPLGSIVVLQSGEKKLMITGRGQLYKLHDVTGYFDYSAAVYPLGLVDGNQNIFFNHEDIAKIVFKGYSDELEDQYMALYEENIKKVNYPKFSVDGMTGK